MSRRKPILVERSPPGDHLRRALSHAAKLHNVLGNQVRILLHSLGDLSLIFLGPPEVRHADQLLLFSTRKELAYAQEAGELVMESNAQSCLAALAAQ